MAPRVLMRQVGRYLPEYHGQLPEALWHGSRFGANDTVAA